MQQPNKPAARGVSRPKTSKGDESAAISGAHTFGTSIVIVGLGFVTSIVLARTAGPSGKGGFDLSMATVGLLIAVFGLALPSGLSFVVARGATDHVGLLRKFASITMLQTGAAAGALLVVSQTGLSSAVLASGTGTSLILPIAITFALTVMVAHCRAILVGLRMIVLANLRDLVGRGATIFILAAVALIARIGSGDFITAQPLVWAGVASAGVALVLFWTAIPPSDGATSSPSALRAAVEFAMPAYGAQLAQFLNYRLDMFLVSLFLGVRDVGLYALAVSLAQLLWLMSSSASTVLFPRVAADSDRARMGRQTARVCRVILAATLLAAICLGLVARWFVPTVYGTAFGPSTEPLLALLPGIVAYAIVNILGAYITGTGKPSLVLAVSVVGLVMTLPLDLVLIPQLGIVGAAAASSASYSASAVAMVGLFLRETGLRARDVVVPERADFVLARAAATEALRRALGRHRGSPTEAP